MDSTAYIVNFFSTNIMEQFINHCVHETKSIFSTTFIKNPELWPCLNTIEISI